MEDPPVSHDQGERRLTLHRDNWFVAVTLIAERTATRTMSRPQGRFEITLNDETLRSTRGRLTSRSPVPERCSFSPWGSV